MKKLFALVSFLMCSYGTIAQEKSLENTVLWKIEHETLSKPSYLLGTIHILCEDDFSIPEKVKKAFKSTENLVLEVDMSDTNALLKAQQKMMSSTKLSEQLSKEEQKFLDELLQKELNMSLQLVDNYSLVTVYTLLIQQGFNCPTKKMYEVELTNMAKAQQKNIGGLETFDFQLDIFEKAYPKDFLWKQFELYEAYKTSLDAMVENYKKEDISAMYHSLRDPRFFNDNAAHWMLTVRNTNWATLMPEMMKKQQTFFAVGAAHLVGEHGVINLLRTKGYTVTPVY